jgi:hypothetical protein
MADDDEHAGDGGDRAQDEHYRQQARENPRAPLCDIVKP